MSLLSYLTFNDINNPLKDIGSANSIWTPYNMQSNQMTYYSDYTKSQVLNLKDNLYSHIKCENISLFELSNKNFTFELWFKLIDNNMNDDYAILAYEKDFRFGISVRYNTLKIYGSSTGNDWYFIAGDSYWDRGTTGWGHTQLQQNKWYHIAVVRNGSIIRSYLDGKVEVECDIGTTSFYTGDCPFYLGRWGDGTTSKILIDNFRFYDNAKYLSEFAPSPFPNVIYSNLTIGDN